MTIQQRLPECITLQGKGIRSMYIPGWPSVRTIDRDPRQLYQHSQYNESSAARTGFPSHRRLPTNSDILVVPSSGSDAFDAFARQRTK